MRTLTTVLVLWALGHPASADALFPGTLPASRCNAAKLRCVAGAKSCLFVCRAKAAKVGTAPDPECLETCRDRFALDPAQPGRGCYAHAESLGDCGSVGEGATMSAAIDAYVAETAATLSPSGGSSPNACTAKKLRCVEKYDRCTLEVARKAAKAGTPLGDLAKCTRMLDGGPTSCVGKAERRYCDPTHSDCQSTAPTCETYYDELVLRTEDDAFVDDVITTIVGGHHHLNAQRCSGDTAVRCTSAPGGTAGCGGTLGTCEFFMGPPRPSEPILFGQFCAVTRFDGAVAGTFDQATGAIDGTATLVVQRYTGPSMQPCPVCEGDPFPNDGAAAGFCRDGAHAGAACDGNGRTPFDAWGTTSLDCPPTSSQLMVTSTVDLAYGTGVRTKTVTATSPTCNGQPGKRCLCASCSLDARRACTSDADCATASVGTCTSPAGESRRVNACYDDDTIPGDGTICAAVGGNEGQCPEGPFEITCDIERFRYCLSDDDCPAPGDRCVGRPRECFPGYDGGVGDAITASGHHEPSRNGAARAAIAAVACLPPTGSSFTNTTLGLPGPLRVELGGITEEGGGPGCPTRLSFLPTAKGPAIDGGWTALAHDQRMIGGAETIVATTCSGAPPACSCTYTGPILHPNAAP